MSSAVVIAVVLPLAVLAFTGAGLYALARKQQDHRRHLDARLDEVATRLDELGRALHDRALALDERCDVLDEQVRRLELRQRIDHLRALVRFGERSGRLEARAAERLELYVLDLAAEAREP